jgi:hypothetical protein
MSRSHCAGNDARAEVLRMIRSLFMQLMAQGLPAQLAPPAPSEIDIGFYADMLRAFPVRKSCLMSLFLPGTHNFSV